MTCMLQIFSHCISGGERRREGREGRGAIVYRLQVELILYTEAHQVRSCWTAGFTA